MLVEHPSIAAYFTSDKTIDKSSPDYNQVAALADARIGMMDAALTYPSIAGVESSIGGWKRTFTQNFKTTPIMCERLALSRDEYGLIVPLAHEACR
jgi:hypothetical protein